MERLLIQLLIGLGLLVPPSCLAGSGKAEPATRHCSKTGGVDNEKSYVDSYELISRSGSYCNITVSTFGYLQHNWAGILLYPDESRAKHQWIPGTISVGENIQKILTKELSEYGGGAYSAIRGTFICGKPHLQDEVGVGRLVEVKSIELFSLDHQGNSVRHPVSLTDSGGHE